MITKIFKEKVVWQVGSSDMSLTSLPKIQFKFLASWLMAAKIILDNISVINNPASFLSGIELDITFTALQAIAEPIEWKIIYVGSAKNEDFDQTLEEFQIGPISEQSTMKFTVDCSAPDYTKIPADELICVTALIITISYRGQEFIRVGYYVHNVLKETVTQEERSQSTIEQLIQNTTRTILTDKPRITKFRIKWGDESEMKEETNNNKIKTERVQNSNSSLLAKKIGRQQIGGEAEEKQSTKEEKEFNSQSLMKSQLAQGQEESYRIKAQNLE